MNFGEVQFETRGPGVVVSALRADVVAFVGFVSLPDPVPASVSDVWRRLGWERDPRTVKPVLVESPADLALLDGTVQASTGEQWEGNLLGAVRDFFRQGGRRCWIIPVGPPPAPTMTSVEVDAALGDVVPGFRNSPRAVVDDRTTWRGVAHLFDLPEVALLAVPDLPSLVGASPVVRQPLPAPTVLQPQFLECPDETLASEPSATLVAYGPPQLDDTHLDTWQEALGAVLTWVIAHRPDIQVLAAWPLGAEGTTLRSDPLQAAEGRLTSRDGGGLGTAWLQLATPWLRTDEAVNRLGGLSAPDGVLAGVLARNSLLQGTFRRAVRQYPEGVTGLEPSYDAATLRRAGATGTLPERLTVIGLDVDGLAVLSDVTTTENQGWRQGGVNRLMGVVRREVMRLGETLVFERNGPATWARVRATMRRMLDELVEVGALDPDDPYTVRCDRSTMTQRDLDTGRLIAEIGFRPSLAIERLVVVLTVVNGRAHAVSGAA